MNFEHWSTYWDLGLCMLTEVFVVSVFTRVKWLGIITSCILLIWLQWRIKNINATLLMPMREMTFVCLCQATWWLVMSSMISMASFHWFLRFMYGIGLSYASIWSVEQEPIHVGFMAASFALDCIPATKASSLSWLSMCLHACIHVGVFFLSHIWRMVNKKPLHVWRCSLFTYWPLAISLLPGVVFMIAFLLFTSYRIWQSHRDSSGEEPEDIEKDPIRAAIQSTSREVIKQQKLQRLDQTLTNTVQVVQLPSVVELEHEIIPLDD